MPRSVRPISLLVVGLLVAARRGRSLQLGLCSVALALAAHASIGGQLDGSYLDALDRLPRVQAFGRTLRNLSSEDTRQSTLSEARAGLAKRYRISPALEAGLTAEAISADPWHISAAWAAGASNWHPVPVFQVYAACIPSRTEQRSGVTHTVLRQRG